ncbi:MAG TPA: hypothetical protein VM324_01575 [Egibacteraceae bacterium]|jgi:hypothetical protein|nr:hypothetical protein [Egibacteraceae bacterium]
MTSTVIDLLARCRADAAVQALAHGDGELAAAASTIAVHARRRHATRLRSLDDSPTGDLVGRVAVAAAARGLDRSGRPRPARHSR